MIISYPQNLKWSNKVKGTEHYFHFLLNFVKKYRTLFYQLLFLKAAHRYFEYDDFSSSALHYLVRCDVDSMCR